MPYAALEESVREAKKELVKRKSFPSAHTVKIVVAGEKWLPDGVFVFTIGVDSPENTDKVEP